MSHEDMAQSSQSPLLKLPPELRNRILAFAIVEEEPIIAYIDQRSVCRNRNADTANDGLCRALKGKRTFHEYKAMPERPSLAQVNRQLRSEALPVFYGQNVFLFSLASRLRSGIKDWYEVHLTEVALNHINHVILEFDMDLITPSKFSEHQVHGEMDIRSRSSETESLAFTYGGGLTDECVFVLTRKITEEQQFFGLANRLGERCVHRGVDV